MGTVDLQLGVLDKLLDIDYCTLIVSVESSLSLFKVKGVFLFCYSVLQ